MSRKIGNPHTTPKAPPYHRETYSTSNKHREWHWASWLSSGTRVFEIWDTMCTDSVHIVSRISKTRVPDDNQAGRNTNIERHSKHPKHEFPTPLRPPALFFFRYLRGVFATSVALSEIPHQRPTKTAQTPHQSRTNIAQTPHKHRTIVAQRPNKHRTNTAPTTH